MVGAASAECLCPADMNADTKRDGEDVQGFIGCMVASGANCSCADVDSNGTLNMVDVGLFVD